MAIKPNFFKALGVGWLIWKVAHYIKTQSALLSKWDYEILEARVADVSRNYVAIDIDLAVTNYSELEAVVKDFTMSVYMDGMYIGKGQSTGITAIRGNSSSRVVFRVIAYFAEVGEALKILLPKISLIGETRIRLKGNFYLETINGVFVPVPFNTEQTALTLYKLFN